MSKSIATAVSGIQLRRATCIHLTRTDSVDEYYTDHDLDLVMGMPSAGSPVFKAGSGFIRTANQSLSDFEVDRLEVSGPLLLDGLDAAELRAGLYDHAVVRVFETDWSAPIYGDAWLRWGWIGEVQIRDDGFQAEIVGLGQIFTKHIVELYSADCSVDLGSTRCGIGLGPFTTTGTVSVVTDDRVFEVSSMPAAAGGLLTWTSGLNTGIAMDVFSIAGSEITLFLQMPFPVQVGDGYSVYRGCDKLFSTCRDVFSNVVNFQGYAVLTPGRLWMTDGPDSYGI